MQLPITVWYGLYQIWRLEAYMKFEEAEGDRSDDPLAPTQCTTLLSNTEPYIPQDKALIFYTLVGSPSLSHIPPFLWLENDSSSFKVKLKSIDFPFPIFSPKTIIHF